MIIQLAKKKFEILLNYYKKKSVKTIINSRQPIYLELGSGPRKGENGWITADICKGADIIMDMLKPFPFPDNSVTKIYSSHVFEHFYTHELEFVLGECIRILKQRGTISVCVPDAKIFVEGYLNSLSFDAGKYCRYTPNYIYYSKIDYLNYIAYMGGHHRHMFDMENLLAILARNGFRNARSREFDPDIDLLDRDNHSIYVEAEK
jgi:predicted SAM-dependent methyltransferase